MPERRNSALMLGISAVWCCFAAVAVVSIIVLIALIVVVMAATKEDRHIVVVGGGLAGLSAALEAARNGAKVTLVEGEKDVGGNSMKASSGINGCWTETQKKLGIKDNVSIFFSDTMSAGDNLNIGDLVDILVHDSKESVEWLTEKGVNLADVNILGGHSVPRTHWIPSPKEGKPNPIGVAIIRALKSHYAELQSLKPDEMKLVTSTKATALIHDEDGKRVVGVKTRTSEGQEGEIRGTAVILTTGGFSNDHTDDSLLRQYAPEYLRYPTTNGPFAQGSGVKMAREIGARLIHMGFVQVHPTGFIDPKDPQAKTKFLAAEALRGSGAILLNQKGERFTNELGRRDHTTENILTHCQKDPVANAHTAWLIMNEPAVDKFGWPAFNFYYKIKGFFEKVGNAEELAEKINAGVEVVKKTLEDYKEIVSKTKTDPFGKKVFPVPFSTAETLYVGRITPSIHYTMGGLEINGKSEVISEKTRQPIPGLYAGGEVTGGVHGKNRLGGNSLLECVVFGRIAGLQAATN